MYNRYIPGPDGYARVPEPDEAPRAAAHHAQETPPKEEKKSGGLSALLRHLKLEDLDGEMMANATNSMKLSELTAEKEKTEKELEEKMDRWVYLNDLAERIEAQKNA